MIESNFHRISSLECQKMYEKEKKIYFNTSFSEKETYFSFAISSHRTVATITYKGVVPSMVNEINIHVNKKA